MNLQEAIDNTTSLFETRKVESPRLSAELIVSYTTGFTRSEILANPEKNLTPSQENQLKTYTSRRLKHEPIPYITGHTEFYSLDLNITPGVFIPRPDTETLVDAALEIASLYDQPKIYDMGTGSGNIIIALAENLDDGDFWASDISNTAIQLAKQNINKYELNNYVELREGTLFSPMRSELTKDFDIFISNPPYIRSNEIPKLAQQIKDHEPHIALDGGRDGMTFVKSIMDGAAPLLKPGGYILLEVDPTLIAPSRTEVRRRGIYGDFTVHKDYAGQDRVIQFRKR